MSALEATVVGTAMPTVVAELGGIDRFAWVGAIYLMASTVSMPLYGKLADSHGRRPTLVIGIVLFLCGSLAAGAAPSMTLLVVARAVQGLGAGAMQPIAMTIVGDLYPLERRGRVVAIFGSVWGLSGIAGAMIGGWIVATIGWRWVFWMNVPLGALSIAVLARNYHERRARSEGVSIDWLGAIALTGASITLLLGGARELPWLTIPVGSCLLMAFGAIERRARNPLLPLTLIVRRGMVVTSMASTLLGAAMMGTLSFVPLFAQGVLGASPSEAGATVAPMVLGWPIAAALTSRALTRIGFRRPVIGGSVVVALGLCALAWVARPGESLWTMRGAMLVFGLGMGWTLTAQVFAVQSSVQSSERGVATAMNLFARSMGGALGVGALGAVLSASLGGRLPQETVAALLDPHHHANVSSESVRGVLAGGLEPIFVVGAALGLGALAVSLFFPREEAPPREQARTPVVTSLREQVDS
jgi:EmrB/QacA subfamily drug resistance transporter